MSTKRVAGKEHSPMMRQYLDVKERYPDYLLLFRVGDFYETFFDDACQVSAALNIVLTRRSNGSSAEIPMAGFPHHASEGYIARLVKKGYKVAVCDQVEDPAMAKGIVRREITDIITPGVTYSDSILDDRHNNYLCAIAFFGSGRKMRCGVAFIDVTTAEFSLTELHPDGAADFLRSLHPAELLVSAADREHTEQLRAFLSPETSFTVLDEWLFREDHATELLARQFRTHSLKGFGINGNPAGRIAAGAILHYLEETRQNSLHYISRIRPLQSDDYMTLDLQTKKNLEIISSMQDGSLSGSLLQVIDRTKNPMGARLIRQWLQRPLLRSSDISLRQDAVEELKTMKFLRDGVSELLPEISDLERVLSRIATLRTIPREVRQLGGALAVIPRLQELLQGASSERLVVIAGLLKPMPELAELIECAIYPDAGASMRDGGYIRPGYHEELDLLRQTASTAKARLLEIQQQERERTSISSLKVQFNRVFGYYIEISRANLDKVPSYYEKKQTLVNAERFTIPELKEYEERILNAEERSLSLEQQLFGDLCRQIAVHAAMIQDNAALVAEIDCLCSFALCADDYGYCKPVVEGHTGLSIVNGRHPVLERIMPADEPYVANDCFFDSDQRMLMITGPNMAGKSSYLRQAGLIVLLAQAGSFVPAEKAEIGIVDRIFTRVGASDNLASGESTFLVEMNEASAILNNATERSLLLLDEIGRGTSTSDGLSIAWSICEFIQAQIGARTLFATHYHELAELESRITGVVNYNATVIETADRVVFLRKIVRGASDNSYGIEVARMAGMPSAVIARAKEILAGMEKRDVVVPEMRDKMLPGVQISLFDEIEDRLQKAVGGLDIDRMTPLEALIELTRLQVLAKTGKEPC
ncbi:MAG: DNA mismatch repair protein MutS [Chlorobium sp.]|uniref:DNA mismatch repair protein MutS n=1 Tax=Chlorobium sp. TaxID=1095 RepID=UPI0025BD1544|nr:DNA mismatch repair protein MutS [Chlorobium sp.]MCF8215644.1 DNA mismatch repair protein MutS [Chlorobium sp.]MCF8270699.1 DNA mismatch repair protein MutS [Chlorobium sp.]MCF8286853.1 DNA mismatch repair protein MutS [Chlorobium sp.]MCF8290571.1 DNA mismatch repair protein MutS [Chlorobium sp.]MCF8384527.1 DNA mismatch repair protein MutS [Chlorobium sp.]